MIDISEAVTKTAIFLGSDKMQNKSIDATYQRLRWQVFLGIYLGYAGYYLVRNNFSLAIPGLVKEGFSKGQLGLALSAVSLAYGISKFVMGVVSDRSNARIFLPLGLLLAAALNLAFGFIPALTSNITIMFIILFAIGWFQGMGWPPSGRVLVHWFSVNERGGKTSLWNTAHNIGGGLMAPLANLGIAVIAASALNLKSYTGVFIIPAVVAIIIALVAFLLIRDSPEKMGLPAIEEYRDDYPTEDHTVQSWTLQRQRNSFPTRLEQ